MGESVHQSGVKTGMVRVQKCGNLARRVRRSAATCDTGQEYTKGDESMEQRGMRTGTGHPVQRGGKQRHHLLHTGGAGRGNSRNGDGGVHRSEARQQQGQQKANGSCSSCCCSSSSSRGSSGSSSGGDRQRRQERSYYSQRSDTTKTWGPAALGRAGRSRGRRGGEPAERLIRLLVGRLVGRLGGNGRRGGRRRGLKRRAARPGAKARHNARRSVGVAVHGGTTRERSQRAEPLQLGAAEGLALGERLARSNQGRTPSPSARQAAQEAGGELEETAHGGVAGRTYRPATTAGDLEQQRRGRPVHGTKAVPWDTPRPAADHALTCPGRSAGSHVHCDRRQEGDVMTGGQCIKPPSGRYAVVT